MYKQKYYNGLNVLRGMSALFIVLYHYTIRYNENPITMKNAIDWPITFPWGCAAVSTFFILSGFLGGKHLMAEKESIWPFIKGRFLRLFPSFFVSVIFTSITTYILLPQAFCGLKDIILNLTMVPSLLGARSVDGAYWTLQMEWTFYIVSAIVMFFSSKKIKMLIPLLWVLMSLLCNEMYNVIPYANVISTLTISKHSQEFIIGVILYNIIILKEYKYSISTALLCVANQISCQDVTHIAFFIFTILYILVTTFPSVDIIFGRKIFKPIVWISEISYPLYLIHQIVGFSIMNKIVQFTGSGNWIIIGGPLLFVIVIAWFVHKYIEIPTVKIFM